MRSIKQLFFFISSLGKDTKTARNNSGPRYKRSSLEVSTNKFILCCVVILVVMCLIGGIASILWFLSFDSKFEDDIIYINRVSTSPVVEGLIMFAASILNYQVYTFTQYKNNKKHFSLKSGFLRLNYTFPRYCSRFWQKNSLKKTKRVHYHFM